MYKALGWIMRSRGLTLVLALTLLALSIGWAMRVKSQQGVTHELERLAAEGARLRLAQFRPQAAPPNTNASAFYLAAIELSAPTSFLEACGEDLVKTVEQRRSEARAFVDDQAVTFTLLARGYERPECSFEYRIEDGFRMRVPNYMRCRALARTAAVRAHLEALEGRPQDAVRTAAWALHFFDRFSYPNSLIHHMITLACHKSVLPALEAMAERGVRTDYSPVLRELRVIRKQQDTAIRECLEVERALALDMFDRILRGEESLTDMLKNSLGTSNVGSQWQAYILAGNTAVLRDEQALLDIYRQAEAAVKANDPSLVPSVDTLPRGALLSGMVIPNFKKAWENDRAFTERLDQLIGRLEKLHAQ